MLFVEGSTAAQKQQQQKNDRAKSSERILKRKEHQARLDPVEEQQTCPCIDRWVCFLFQSDSQSGVCSERNCRGCLHEWRWHLVRFMCYFIACLYQSSVIEFTSLRPKWILTQITFYRMVARQAKQRILSLEGPQFNRQVLTQSSIDVWSGGRCVCFLCFQRRMNRSWLDHCSSIAQIEARRQGIPLKANSS